MTVKLRVPHTGIIATSLEANPAWEQRCSQIHQALLNREQQKTAQIFADVERARQMGDQIHANNEAFLRRSEANRAQSRARENTARSSSKTNSNDGFDQYIRGTERMQDQNGVVSDQYTDYNYHWTDGSGNFVHTNDQTIDPNKYLNGNYQQMTSHR